MVEHNLAKVGAAGSIPVSRSMLIFKIVILIAQVVEMVDTRDLKSLGPSPYRFKSGLGHHLCGDIAKW